ncbi:MAG: GWxTD domain-containing protein [bacterium]|nr:MAG: GWxTD domain-containing protein [bacterium]
MGRRPEHLLAVVLLTVCLISCAKKQALEDDFIQPITSEERENVWEAIAELKEKIREDYKNADLHRELAVKYRLAGTPESRLRSMTEIEKAIELNPRDPRNYIEKGLTLRARQFYGDAAACFEHATKLSPKSFEAWYQLGSMEQTEYLKMMCFPEHLRKAIRHYQKAYRLDRKHEELLIRLGFLHLFRKMFRTGKKYADKALIYYPENVRAHLLLGTIHIYLKEFDKAREAYQTAFGIMSTDEIGAYEDIAILLSPDDRELYQSSTDEVKLKWNKRFWAENDPTPATEINERLLEHYKRVFLAQELLTNNRLGLRGDRTDRGKAIISYGLPHKKAYDLGGGQVGPWLVWHYDLPNFSFNLFFHDEFLNGDFHIPITDRSYGERTVSLMNNIPQSYEYPVKYFPLPIKVETAQLRGSEERTRLEFSLAIPDTSIKQTRGDWQLHLTFFDPDWTRLSHDFFPFESDTLKTISRLGERFLVSNFWFEVLPRPLGSTCIIEVRNEDLKRKGTWRQFFEISDLHGRSLKLSSIKLTLADANGGCTDILDPMPVYPNGSTLCLAYQIYNLRRNENNQARYRLTYTIKNPQESPEDKKGIRRTFAYIWRGIKGGTEEESPYITSTLEQSINESVADDRLQIDISKLEQGRYELVLTVEDQVSGQVASENRIFLITGQWE